MAAVLSSEDLSIFGSSSGLRRSHSHSHFLSHHTGDLNSTSASSRLDDDFRDSYRHPVIVPDSSSSSGPPSPHHFHPSDSSNHSYPSTPASNLSLDGGSCDFDMRDKLLDDTTLGDFEGATYYAHVEDLEPPVSPHTGDSYTVSPTEPDTSSASTSRPQSPDTAEHAEDDTAAKHHPTQHVDYLSHNWKEEDIWSSWRYLVSKRGDYSNSSRLENASWRTWMKAKYRLKTVSPETLNWLKDCDVTWLYGPLQPSTVSSLEGSHSRGRTRGSRSPSYGHKKPILKKRSMSEVMLQKSNSSSSLLKQATAAIEAEQRGSRCRIPHRPIIKRATTDFMAYPMVSQRGSRFGTSPHPSTDNSGIVSPTAERKHIHFDEQVKQCIAVDVKGDEDDDELDPQKWDLDNDSESDDGAIMMKSTRSAKRSILPRRRAPVPINDSKTIAMLPSTTLKYRIDSPEPRETAMKHSGGPVLSTSSSQETLRPSKPATSLLYQYDEQDSFEMDTGAQAPISSPVDAGASYRYSSFHRSPSSDSLLEAPQGMKRTESGMLMPVDEDGNLQPGQDGIIGRVIDTVNTAKDIAHVIWNVGWNRK
ncbi:uncharacterized protein B0I36DRAFT_258324 [Microdochium trichocladiopsis]|uniref:Nitrogen regulatory protein areA GATA-like domain-containing protein n=1 Tax=Microdochium trichocladiopsis TaxID=1682393 RepID=A0A9P8XP03_9PEZI|nr:uncharacterized protein B0I36DRAFT_258324 [Microdochium trichocladiopsis]KAH7007896.1 hypothetical protein B0I36DRAFT_258324 [Microdochium trichocladiopsis]